MDKVLSVRISEQTQERLEAVAACNDRTVSQELRRMIREFLAREEALTP
jgi:predicted transcriptional regulator